MIITLLRFGSWIVASVLLFFTARRWLFVCTALLPYRANDKQVDTAGNASQENAAQIFSVLILIPARNEAGTLPGLLEALDYIEYPDEELTVVMVDDGSTDSTYRLMADWAMHRRNWYAISLPENMGKAHALNAGLTQFPDSEIIAVYDADERPRPGTLCHLVKPFYDETVGAVSGRRVVSNPLNSVAASYTTFENLVHQLITMRAKDRLDLAPAILGANCAYRRTALEAVGAFKPGALLEDSDLSLKLPRAGWKIRFEELAVSKHSVPESVSGYWRQHTRWARGFNDVAQAQSSTMIFSHNLSLALRLELLAFSVGYLDRLALVAAGGLLILKRWSRFPGWIFGLSLLTPLVQTLAALKINKAPRALWHRVAWMPFFFAIDLAMAAFSALNTIRRQHQPWEERQRRQ